VPYQPRPADDCLHAETVASGASSLFAADGLGDRHHAVLGARAHLESSPGVYTNAQGGLRTDEQLAAGVGALEVPEHELVPAGLFPGAHRSGRVWHRYNGANNIYRTIGQRTTRLNTPTDPLRVVPRDSAALASCRPE
jgi:hypothetical protein